MKLPFFSNAKKEALFYFGLFLKEEEGIAMVMKSNGDDLVVIEQEKFTLSNGWSNITEDVDEILVKLEDRLKRRLHETIFYVYSHFIDEKTNDVKKMYLDKIKKLVESLELKPLGYIECYEGVKQHLEKKEEVPLSAVVIEIDKTALSIFVYKRGNQVYSKALAHTDNLVDDLLTSFAEIKGKFLLPSRIILYDSKNLNDESSELLTFRWSEDLFVQLPRVEVIKESEILTGLASVFSEQINSKKGVADQKVMGFVIGEDIAARGESDNETFPASAEKSIPKTNIRLEAAAAYFKKIPRILSRKITIIIGCITIIVGLTVNEYFFHKADLTLFLPAKTAEKSLSIKAPVEERSSSAQYSESKSVTGKKEIGEKAKGSITIHNFDEKEKTISKGTVVESEGVAFTLDQDVKVASSSVVLVSGGLVKQPGKAKTTITALELGAQGNLASGKQFTIENLSQNLYFGLNESPISGGSKSQVKTVAKKDIEDLKVKIIDKAKQQKPDASLSENKAEVMINQLSQYDLSDVNANNEVGEEAENVSVKAVVKTTYFYIKKDSLIDEGYAAIQSEVEKGYKLVKSNISYKISKADKTTDGVKIEVSFQAKAIQETPVGEIVSSLRGKSKNEVDEILRKNFRVNGYKLDIAQNLPFIKNIMPFFGKNIEIHSSVL